MKLTIGNDRLTMPAVGYRGRIAPTPTGYLHLGHARTFSIAHQRARTAGGEIVYRCEDLDPQRCKREFAKAAIDDLQWLGLDWDGGPEFGDEKQRWTQSVRHELGVYEEAWRVLRDLGVIYPSDVSRRDLASCTDRAPEALGGEVIFPEAWREEGQPDVDTAGAQNWRFRVDYAGLPVEVEDGNLGRGSFQPGRDYGDFLVWRRDGFPSYELAVVVDDILMRITEVVRGADLWVSTARQIELYRAFEAELPHFFHCDLVKDDSGQRLAKRAGSMGIRELRNEGFSAKDVLNRAEAQV